MKEKLRIGVFAYNFKHKKTFEGLINLYTNNYEVSCILAADPVTLAFYQSKIRVAPKGLDYSHPKELAERFNIPYYVVPHNSEECGRLIKRYNLDLGIILGARILKEHIIKAFKIGILNLHPGLLPHNRGLDTIKWAILKKMKQGASAHLISKEIDRGQLILKREIEVYQDDSLLDIFVRIQNMEQTLMLESLNTLESGKRDFEDPGEGAYFKAVPEDLEKTLLKKFEEYKKEYSSLQ